MASTLGHAHTAYGYAQAKRLNFGCESSTCSQVQELYYDERITETDLNRGLCFKHQYLAK